MRTNFGMLLIMLGMMVQAAWAQTFHDPVTYYQNANGKKGAALKTALKDIIFNHTERDYNDLWTDFRATDALPDNPDKVWDMYSNDTIFTFGTNQDTGSGGNIEGVYYNREHSFPNSWFGGKIKPMYTDLNHLYPTDKCVNNKRSNYPFGETKGEEFTSANGFSKLGACTYPGYTGTVFEPNDEYKGDFARTYFYMITCYEEQLPDWYSKYSEVRPTIDGSKYPGFTSWQLAMLMKWATQDPVSQKEIDRNQAVDSIQHNRNPFIDYPGLEQYIWGNKTNVAFQSAASSVSLVDGTSYTNAGEQQGLDITYSRIFKNTNWQPWYVPFDMVLTSETLANFSFARFAGTYTEEDGTFYLTIVRLREGAKIKANTAYFVQAKTADSNNAQVISVSNATLYPAVSNSFYMLSADKKITVTGIYEPKYVTEEDKGWYAYSGGKYSLQNKVGGAPLNPYRFFVTITDRDDNPYADDELPGEVKIKVLGDDETDLEMVKAKSQDIIYDLQGRTIVKGKSVNSEWPKGLYIVNGKKVIIK